ncbi:MAG: WD40 repeat domain-containing protein [Helicobacteraceae bacterium]|jgi:outer membrane protein assembly factor BamB|nr:WD40 repeat domain-containing protein [Helicobacteraceae bacterium]
MKTSLLLALTLLFLGCASKQKVETPIAEVVETAKSEPKLIWTSGADSAIAVLGAPSQYSAIALAPDRASFVSGDWDKRVLLWEFESGALLKEFAGHTDKIVAAAFSADGKTLFSASLDKTIRAWDIASGKQIRTFFVRGVTFNVIATDGARLIGAGDDSVIRVWNVKNGKLIRQIKDRRVFISSIAIAKNKIIRGGYDKLIKIYDIKSGKLLRSFKGHNEPIYAIAAQNETLYSSGGDKTIRVWNIAKAKLLKTIKTPETAIAISVDKDRLASGGENGAARLFDIASGKEIRSFTQAPIGSIALFNNYALVGSENLRFFSAIDPNKIGFDEILKKADQTLIKEYEAIAAEGDAANLESFVQNIDERRLSILQKTLAIYWGDPRLSELTYNEENQTAIGFIKSLRDGFSRKIAFTIAPDEALELFFNPTNEPYLTFTLKEGALLLENIAIKDAWGEYIKADLIDENQTILSFSVPPLDFNLTN